MTKNIFKLPSYVGIILVKDDKVLLVKRHNTDWASGSWNFPGGLLEENETLISAAAREAAEEIGVVIEPNSLSLVHVIQVRTSVTNTKDILGFYFMAKTWQGIPVNNEPMRHSEISWFSVNDINISKNTEITEHALQALNGLKTGQIYSEN